SPGFVCGRLYSVGAILSKGGMDGSADTGSDFWVFGYGSLMSRPGFPHEEQVEARLLRAHRALCVNSVHPRGSVARPGLVLGLDRGGSCRGVAFRVKAADREEVIAYLRAREQVTAVYVEAWRPIRFMGGQGGGGQTGVALTYLVDRRHPQYAGILPIE